MLGMHSRPSEIMDIEDAYLAFCFDEACAFIIKKIMDGEEPIIRINPDNGNKEYKLPSDLYKKYE